MSNLTEKQIQEIASKAAREETGKLISDMAEQLKGWIAEKNNKDPTVTDDTKEPAVKEETKEGPATLEDTAGNTAATGDGDAALQEGKPVAPNTGAVNGGGGSSSSSSGNGGSSTGDNSGINELKTIEGIMPEFISTLYGVVVGVNSLQFFKSIKELSFFNQLPFPGYPKGEEGGEITIGILIFKLLFFAFSVLIVMHDWYTFHKKGSKASGGKGKDLFWLYVPHLFSLFFLGQMLNAASNNEMVAWFGWGILYTVCNWWSDRGSWSQLRKKYLLHVLICIAGIFFLFRVENIAEAADQWHWMSVILFVLIFLVVLIWQRHDHDGEKNYIAFTLIFAFVAIILAKVISSTYDTPTPDTAGSRSANQRMIDEAVSAITGQIAAHNNITSGEIRELAGENSKQYTDLRQLVANIKPGQVANLSRLADTNFVKRVLNVLRDSLHEHAIKTAAADAVLTAELSAATESVNKKIARVQEYLIDDSIATVRYRNKAVATLDSTLYFLNDNFEQLRKRFKKRSLLKKTDIERLRIQVDSLRGR